ncbi:hypothetical protein [Flavobacterium sp. WC2509]|uniref:hypothetical protein n=1 Tax=Flavobacterium sp. WC2509 TaxID=3461406 RepID=UPI004044F71B
MKTKIFFSIVLALLVHSFGFAAIITSANSGLWSDGTTWVGGSVPLATDEVIIDSGHTIEVIIDTQCAKITLDSNIGKLIIYAPSTLSVSGNILVRSSNSSLRLLTIAGDGTLICASIDVGIPTTTPGNTRPTGIISYISNLTITADLNLYSTYSSPNTNNASFNFENGSITVGGQIKTTNQANSESTFIMPSLTTVGDGISILPSTSYSKTLILTNASPFLLSATPTSTMTLNGDNATVKYSGNNQAIHNTEYYNLNLATSGTKTFPGTAINIKNKLSIDASVTANLNTTIVHTAKSMTLGGILRENGTWGSTLSAPDYTNNTFFASTTGKVKVGATCSGTLKTWTTSWLPSTPTINDPIVFNGNYPATAADISGCSCTINLGAVVVIKTGQTMTIANEVKVTSGSLTFEDKSSLVQNNYVVNTGNITYIRKTNIKLYDYTFWSSPVSGVAMNAFSPNTISDGFQDYDNIKWSFVGGPTIMIPGLGNAIMAPKSFTTTAANFDGTFTGVPNNGDISVTRTGAWKLIGNPYPSALDTKKFLSANINLYGTVYFWRHITPPATGSVPGGAYQYNYTQSDYAPYNITGGVSVDNTVTPIGDIDYISAGQAFMIAGWTNDPIVFTNDMRVGGSNNSTFYKMTKKTTTEKNRVWLNLTNNEGLFKQILIGYVDGATNDFDRLYDGVSLNSNTYANFYSNYSTSKLVIQGRALPFSDTDEVPLGYMVNLAKTPAVQSKFTISIDHTDGNLDNQTIYLLDKETNTTYDLRTGGYNFNSSDGTFNNRFVLKYTNKTLGVDDFENTSKELTITVKNKVISINAKSETIDKVVVYDLSGKTIYSKDKINNSVAEVSNLRINNEVLLVKIIFKNGVEQTRKVILN